MNIDVATPLTTSAELARGNKGSVMSKKDLPTAFHIEGGKNIRIRNGDVFGYDLTAFVGKNAEDVEIDGIRSYSNDALRILSFRQRFNIPDSISNDDLKDSAIALHRSDVASEPLKRLKKWVASQPGLEWAKFATDLLHTWLGDG